MPRFYKNELLTAAKLNALEASMAAAQRGVGQVSAMGAARSYQDLSSGPMAAQMQYNAACETYCYERSNVRTRVTESCTCIAAPCKGWSDPQMCGASWWEMVETNSAGCVKSPPTIEVVWHGDPPSPRNSSLELGCGGRLLRMIGRMEPRSDFAPAVEQCGSDVPVCVPLALKQYNTGEFILPPMVGTLPKSGRYDHGDCSLCYMECSAGLLAPAIGQNYVVKRVVNLGGLCFKDFKACEQPWTACIYKPSCYLQAVQVGLELRGESCEDECGRSRRPFSHCAYPDRGVLRTDVSNCSLSYGLSCIRFVMPGSCWRAQDEMGKLRGCLLLGLRVAPNLKNLAQQRVYLKGLAGGNDFSCGSYIGSERADCINLSSFGSWCKADCSMLAFAKGGCLGWVKLMCVREQIGPVWCSYKTLRTYVTYAPPEYGWCLVDGFAHRVLRTEQYPGSCERVIL